MFLYGRRASQILGEYQVYHDIEKGDGDFILGTNEEFNMMQLTSEEFIFFFKYRDNIKEKHRTRTEEKYCIPHKNIIRFEITNTPTSSSIRRALRGYSLKTVIEIDYVGSNNKPCFIKCSMLVFFDNAKNHAECEKLVHLMKANGIFEKFKKSESSTPQADIPAKIKQLAELHEQGVLTVEEFESKKKELLDRI